MKPYLSATRASRVVPVAHVPPKLLRRVESGPQRAYRAASVASFRVKYARLQTHLARPSVNACLDFEITPFAGCDVALEELTLQLEDGEVEGLVCPDSDSLPLKCRYGDNLTVIYRLTLYEPTEQALYRYSKFRMLDVTIQLRALVSPVCQPQITIKWRTSADFSSTLHPPSDLLNQRQPQLDEGSSEAIAAPHTVASPEARSKTPVASDIKSDPQAQVSLKRSDGSSWRGLSVTISGVPQVSLGEVFRWRVFIVNRSAAIKELALRLIPSQRHSGQRVLSPQPPHQVARPPLGQRAEAVLDERSLYAIQRAAAPESAQVICLSADVRLRSVNAPLRRLVGSKLIEI